MERKEFKILQLSNAWFAPSGYGVESYGTLFDWLRAGYDVRQVSNYGIQGSKMGFADPKKPAKDLSEVLHVYPTLPGDDTGSRTAQLIFPTWKPHVFVVLYDIWMGAYCHQDTSRPSGLRAIHPFFIPWIMVDHDPIPEGTLINAAEAYMRTCPTRFGCEQFEKRGLDCRYVPFGQDPDIFKPAEDGNKSKYKEWLNKRSVVYDLRNNTDITEDSFVIFLNGANKDPYRKAFARSFTAIQIFLENNPDAWRDVRVYVHSWQKMTRDLPHGAKTLQIEGVCRGTHDYHNLCGVPSDKVADMYRAADVFLHLTQGGGFEIPILEAIMSGTPVIGSDFVGIPELIKGHGWLIPAKTKYWSSLDSLQYIADEYKAADAIEEAYNSESKRKEFAEAGRRHALNNYTWKHCNDAWLKLFDEIRESVSYTELNTRKL